MEPELSEEPELLGELEPHAPITVAAASAASAAVPRVRRRAFLQLWFRTLASLVALLALVAWGSRSWEKLKQS